MNIKLRVIKKGLYNEGKILVYNDRDQPIILQQHQAGSFVSSPTPSTIGHVYTPDEYDLVDFTDEPLPGRVLSPLEEKALAVGMNLVSAAKLAEQVRDAKIVQADAEAAMVVEYAKAEDLLRDLFAEGGLSPEAVNGFTNSLMHQDEEE